MGVTDEFVKAQELCRSELGFDISGEASEFRMAIKRAGQKRGEHCITLVALWQRPGTRGVDKYHRLMQLLRLVTPDKAPGTKLRNPAAERAHAIAAELDAQAMALVNRED